MGNLMTKAISEREREREREEKLPGQNFLELGEKQTQARFSGKKTENRAYVFIQV